MPLVYAVSEKGKQMLLVDGFVHYKNKVIQEKTYWKCKLQSCHARVQTVKDDIFKNIGCHNHSADAALTEARNILNDMKNRSKKSFDSPHQILSSSACTIQAEVAPKLPSINSLKKTLRRSRNSESEVTITNPLTTNELELPLAYTTTSRNENFLLFDSGSDCKERMLVFGTKENLNLLQQAKHWYVDGTFKSVPSLFYQLYTLHGIIRDNIIVPFVYALLPNKKSSTYIKLLKELKILEPRLNPSTVMMDYEKAMVNAFETVFSNTYIRGINFNYILLNTLQFL